MYIHTYICSSKPKILWVLQERARNRNSLLGLERGVVFIDVLVYHAHIFLALHEAVPDGKLFDLLAREQWKLLRGPHVGDFFRVAFGKDDVDLFEGSVLGFRVEEIDDGDEARVERAEEEVSAPANALNKDGGDHDDLFAHAGG
jgi:hypothetical protein